MVGIGAMIYETGISWAMEGSGKLEEKGQE